ncbi:MAG: hypothetical protein VX438_03540 [Planctomycetota bacterium]|nr:hypothetical protein [Planctomycetota bacterium]
MESQDDFTLLPSKATAKKRKTEQTRPQQNGVDKNNPDQNLPTAQPGYPATPPKARSKRRKTGPQKKELPESLLPQKSKTSGDEPLLPAAKKNGQDDELLPQAATAKPVSKQEVEHGSVPGANLNQNVISEDEKVLLPDGHGGFIEVSERKTTVSYRGAKIELSSMKREDREVSRTLNNFIVATVSIILLVTLMVVLKWLS